MSLCPHHKLCFQPFSWVPPHFLGPGPIPCFLRETVLKIMPPPALHPISFSSFRCLLFPASLLSLCAEVSGKGHYILLVSKFSDLCSGLMLFYAFIKFNSDCSLPLDSIFSLIHPVSMVVPSHYLLLIVFSCPHLKYCHSLGFFGKFGSAYFMLCLPSLRTSQNTDGY